ncbi:MAG: hypothetical protein DMG72_09235 [Acidobacteria bacterium]|nr:MAG: hypothetical protein DMG72_09235 [Acidobacteriota bacterium]
MAGDSRRPPPPKSRLEAVNGALPAGFREDTFYECNKKAKLLRGSVCSTCLIAIAQRETT